MLVKKLMTVLLAASMIFTFTACGENKDASKEATEGSAETAEQAADTASDSASEEESEDTTASLYVDMADDGGLEIGLNGAKEGDEILTGMEITKDYPFFHVKSDFEGEGTVTLQFIKDESDIDNAPDDSAEADLEVSVANGEDKFYALEAGYYNIKVIVNNPELKGFVWCTEGREGDDFTP